MTKECIICMGVIQEQDQVHSAAPFPGSCCTTCNEKTLIPFRMYQSFQKGKNVDVNDMSLLFKHYEAFVSEWFKK